MRSPYYTNDDLESLINDLDNETENSMKVALKTILLMLKEIRDNQLKKLCTCSPKVFTEPTDNPNDIIVGGLHINNTETVKHNTGTPVIMPQGGTCNCPICRSGK